MNRDRDRLAKAAEKIVKTLILIAVPIAIITYSVADSLAVALFGAQWTGIGLVIGVMALVHGFAWVVGMNGEIYRALGKPSFETIVPGTTLLVYLLAYIYSIRYGFEAFIWTRLTLVFVALILHFLILKKILLIRLRRLVVFLAFISLLCFAVVCSVTYLLGNSITNVWAQFIISGLLSAALIGSVLICIEKDKLVKDIIELVKGRSA
jgi:O-antigen/teichoic acid export membrane protein